MKQDFDWGLIRSFLAALDCGSLLGAARALGTSQTAACYLLPPILARMQQVLPDIQVELVVSNAVSNLLRREGDIALRMVQPAQSTLIAKRIGKLTIGAYAQQDYLRRCGTPRQPVDRNADAVPEGL